MKKTNKIIISLIFNNFNFFNAINSCIMSKQESNRWKHILIILPPQTIDNQKQQEDNSKEEKPNEFW